MLIFLGYFSVIMLNYYKMMLMRLSIVQHIVQMIVLYIMANYITAILNRVADVINQLLSNQDYTNELNRFPRICYSYAQ